MPVLKSLTAKYAFVSLIIIFLISAINEGGANA
jgi:hypothetical protein